jgi:hypothetical protein
MKNLLLLVFHYDFKEIIFNFVTMKTITLKTTFIALFFIAMAATVNAQSAVSVYIRDSDPATPPAVHTYQTYIAVWDNNTGTTIGTTQLVSPQNVDMYNTIPTTVSVPADNTQRWRIIIRVEEWLGSSLITYQIRQTGLLTTLQYETAALIPIVVNPITFP